ncbi:hypothetical protein SALBM217S_04479 [Streptomyces griseoloalbus]
MPASGPKVTARRLAAPGLPVENVRTLRPGLPSSFSVLTRTVYCAEAASGVVLCQRLPSAASSPARCRPEASTATTSVMRPSESSATISRGLSGSAGFPSSREPLKEIWSAASYGSADSGLPSEEQPVTPAPRAATSSAQPARRARVPLRPARGDSVSLMASR